MAQRAEADSRSRILDAARALFYRNGIQATGVGELMSAHGLVNERNLDRDDLAPRERLVALFERPRLSARFRGCPLRTRRTSRAG
jgi:hypothetical protein